MLSEAEQWLMDTLDDPVRFAEDILGLKLWQKQKEILWSIRDSRYVAIKSCNSAGKTFLLAIAIIWWTVRGEYYKAISTAANFVQVEMQLWSEVRQMIANCPHKLVKELNLTEFKNGPANWARGLATDKGVRIQGFKGPVLSALDEAMGIREEVWTGVGTLMSNAEAHLVVSFNPTVPSGKPYEIFGDTTGKWKLFTVSAYDTPNLQGLTESDIESMKMDDPRLDRVVFKGLITPRYVWEVMHEYGKDDWHYQAYILGEFPQGGPGALVEGPWLDEASKEVEYKGGKIYGGLDIAGEGRDNSVLVLREEDNIIAIKKWHTKDVRGFVVEELRKWGIQNIGCVYVDSVGMGYYVPNDLRSAGITAVGVNVGETKGLSDPRRFKNKKAQYFWTLRERFEQGRITGVTDPVLKEQLRRMRYDHNGLGQIFMEDKKAVRKFDKYSPDEADACMLAFSHEANTSTLVLPKDSGSKPLTAGLWDMKL